MSNLLHKKNFSNYTTPFHLVDPSPWPIITTSFLFLLPLSLLKYFESGSALLFIICLGLVFLIIALWADDIIVEGTYQGMHTSVVQRGIIIGFGLFILSEVLLFLTFFFSYFYISFEPSIWIGGAWVPSTLSLVHPLAIPLLNSLILLSSSVFITFAHEELISNYVLILESGSYSRPNNAIFVTFMTLLTIVFGVIFLLCQLWEYKNAQVSIQDTVFGSFFYLITGFHGLHVFFGIIFLTISLIRLINYNFTKEHHLGFEFAAFYWHFVDTIWFFVFLILYYSAFCG